MASNTSKNGVSVTPALKEHNSVFGLQDIMAKFLPDGWISRREGNFSDFWSSLSPDNFRYGWEWTAIILVAHLVLFLVGILANSLIILVVLRRPKIRTVNNMLILNLAIADLIVILFCVPADLLSAIYKGWMLGSHLCKSVAFVETVASFASANLVMAIAMDRCKAIYRPMERPRGLSDAHAAITVSTIWILALLLSIPSAIVFDIKITEDDLAVCAESRTFAWRNIYFIVVKLLSSYFLPLAAIATSNLITWQNVSAREIPLNSACTLDIQRMHEKTRRGVRLILIVGTMAFMLSLLPSCMISTFKTFSPLQNLTDGERNLLFIATMIAQWLQSCNSTVNPMLYAFTSPKFRMACLSLFPKWMLCTRTKSSGSTGSNEINANIQPRRATCFNCGEDVDLRTPRRGRHSNIENHECFMMGLVVESVSKSPSLRHGAGVRDF